MRALVATPGFSLCAALLLATFGLGCAARQSVDPLLALELQQARERNDQERQRVAALEARLAHLEHDAAWRAEQEQAQLRHQANSPDARLLDKLNELLAINQRLLEEAEAARERVEAAQAQKASDLDASTEPAPTDLPSLESREERLRQIVYELHGKPGRFRGGLSLEQSEALRVLLRSERNLDLDNPWSK